MKLISEVLVPLLAAISTGCLDATAISGHGSNAPVTKEGFAAPPPKEEVSQYVASAKGVESFRKEYWDARKHKAFASSEDGAWGWSYGMNLEQRAKDVAWTSCQGHIAANQRPCRVVNADGVWVGKPFRFPAERKQQAAVESAPDS